ncbi:MAG: translation elongation factor Ts [Syntrophomonadaceae bacterium]|nr:translation elongation factor Ts [Syntrophomonadaceae bacterium]
MEISAAKVKELRERTGAGMMDCKKALVESKGDLDKAMEYLREKGLAAAAKKAGRVTAEGKVASYIHLGGRIGVLVEVNCETDFVAKTKEYGDFCHDLAMQIAAARPIYVDRDQVPAAVVEKERSILHAQAINEGKPEKVAERMVEGRLEKFYREVCLLEQPFIKNPDITVKQLLTEMISRLGENITVRRFARFELGEGIARPECNLADEISKLSPA